MSPASETQRTEEDLGYEHEEYMLEPVPRSARRKTIGIAAIWVGFGFVVTGLIVGGQLAGQGDQPGMTLGGAVGTIAIGELVLFSLTVLLGIPAMRTGFNLALLSKVSYGDRGFILPMVFMALLTLGWFASILGMIGEIWGVLLGNPTGITVIDPAAFGRPDVAPVSLEVVLTCVAFGALFTWTAYRGISAIEKVALPIAPLLLVVALYAGVGMLNDNGGWDAMVQEASTRGGLPIGTGITIVVGAWIAGAVMGADIMRFAKNTRAVVIGAAAAFILTNPLLNVVGYIGSIATGDSNFVNWMYTKGLVLTIIGVIVWTTSLWTTENSELYSNSLYTGPVLHGFGVGVKRKSLVLIVGVVGTILGSLAFYQLFFNDFITVLGAAFVPLVSPIIADYFLLRRGAFTPTSYREQPPVRWFAVISFIVGAGCGLLFQYVWPLPGDFSASLAALVIAFVVHVVLHLLAGTRSQTTTEPVNN
ncbi:purine-cytosine permease family protein [Ruania albidiflava]|uniref:purine-cytosine permease family protein n=1 Tax=Ruania albidiflava TaxID=366586 RepID=UPI0023F50FC3|nr:cytosine permease [Ruania albidiflava]